MCVSETDLIRRVNRQEIYRKIIAKALNGAILSHFGLSVSVCNGKYIFIKQIVCLVKQQKRSKRKIHSIMNNIDYVR